MNRTLTASAVMLCSMFLLCWLSRAEAVKPNRSFESFPLKIDEWSGKAQKFDDRIYDILGVDDSILNVYSSPAGSFVNLYVGFYQSQKEGDLIHSPKNCMPGSGWNITGSSIEEIRGDQYPSGTLRAVRLDLKKGNQRQIMLYWFQSRGRIISSEYMQKIYLVIDSILRRRTDGAFVRLVSPVINGDDEKSIRALKEFTVKITPHLKAYLPS